MKEGWSLFFFKKKSFVAHLRMVNHKRASLNNFDLVDVQLLLEFIVFVCTPSRLHINVTCLSNCSNERHLLHCDCNVKETCVIKIVLWRLPYIRSFFTIHGGPWNALTRSVLCSDLLIEWSMLFFGWIVLCSGNEKIDFAFWLCNQLNLYIDKHVFVGWYRRTVKVS